MCGPLAGQRIEADPVFLDHRIEVQRGVEDVFDDDVTVALELLSIHASA